MKPDFSQGLVPAIVQDYITGTVLMLGYMNEESYQKTIDTKLITFFSRSRNQLWIKGETSGNYLDLVELKVDCDNDAILVTALARGNTCHTGSLSCFSKEISGSFLADLENLIRDRKLNPQTGSYTSSLFTAGTSKIAQKVGEEAVETVIDAVRSDKIRLKEECADLLYHLLILLADQDLSLSDVINILRLRQK